MVSFTSPTSNCSASFRAYSTVPLLPNSRKTGFLPCKLSELSSLSRCKLFFGDERCSSNTTVPASFKVNVLNSSGRSRKSKGSAKSAPKKKERPWKEESAVTTIDSNVNRKPSSGGRRGSSSSEGTRKDKETTQLPATSRIIVSAAMPVETEVVLQTQEPSVTPSWKTFASSHCGVWRGIGAAFSPMTAEMEPVSLGDVNEYLYDCRIYSTVQEVQGKNSSSIQRKTVWAVGNPYGEQGKRAIEIQHELPDEMENEDGTPENTEEDSSGNSDILVSKDENSNAVSSVDMSFPKNGTQPGGSLADTQERVNGDSGNEELSYNTVMEADLMELEPGPADTQEEFVTADLESKELKYSSVMEEDIMELEPGLIFFEDGSYSRGPLELLTGDTTLFEFGSTYKIEQCLVIGGHRRLRLVHTIGVEEEWSEIELLRVAVYEEEWMGPCNVKSISDVGGHHLSLFSTRERTLQQELAGSWKVFEVSATAVLPEESVTGSLTDRPPYVYLSMETVKRRLLPEKPVHFVDEDILDMQDVTVLWLPGGITAYVDQKEDGVLTIGIGWYNDGVNLVMERVYNANGRLYEVRTKSEVKGGWVGGRM